MTRTEEQKAFIWKAVDRRRASFIAQQEKAMLGALNVQIAPAIAAVERGADPEKAISDNPIQSAFINLYTKVGVEFARQEYRNHKKSSSSTYDIKAEPESVWMRFMRRFAIEEAGERIKKIGETTLKHVRTVLEEAVREGYSIERTVGFMKDKFGEINAQRARVIALTEIVSASNAGSYAGAKSTGLKMNKEWLATRDSRTRSSHMGVDGQTVDIEEDFTVNGAKLAYPGDPRGPAGEVIQCRCTQVYNPK